jgi:peptidoglycan/LPS O-acetylase OafA/YrhL
MARSSHFVSLDWLRGLAALFVFAMHVELSIGNGRMFSHGYLAVDLFFVLSGFVISHSYEISLSKPGGVRKFAVARFIRLYPLATLGSVVGILSWMIGRVETHYIFLVLAFQILLIPQLWQGSTLFLLNSVHWSLMLEVLANIAHACCLRRLSTPVVTVVAFFGWLMIVASAWYWGSLSVGYARNNALGGVARLIFGYASGIALQRLRASGRMPDFRAAPVLVAALPLFLLVPGIPALDHWWFADVFVVTLLPGLVFVTLSGDVPASLYRAARALGDLSYPLYAIHLPLLMAGMRAARFFWPTGAASFVAAGGVVFGLVGLALLTQRFYDVPVRRWMTVKFRTRRSRVSATIAP